MCFFLIDGRARIMNTYSIDTNLHVYAFHGCVCNMYHMGGVLCRIRCLIATAIDRILDVCSLLLLLFAVCVCVFIYVAFFIYITINTQHKIIFVWVSKCMHGLCECVLFESVCVYLAMALHHDHIFINPIQCQTP